MTATKAAVVLKRIRELTAGEDLRRLTDPELLERFTRGRDPAAFEALLRRHGPLVLGVCRRVLANRQDAEDAFQATFLVLAQRVGSIRKQDALASWLYGVAYRVAVKARARSLRRQKHEARAAGCGGADPLAELTGRELTAVLDEELQRLPESYRAPLVLCYLEGKTRDEAAAVLGWSLSTLQRRLEKGRGRLRLRLVRRGLALPNALLAAGLYAGPARAAVPGALAAATVRSALLPPGAGAAAALVRSTLQGIFAAPLRATGIILLVAGALVACVAPGSARLLPSGSPAPTPAGQERAKGPVTVPRQAAQGDQREITVAGRVVDVGGQPVKGARVGVLAVPDDWAKRNGPDAEHMVALGHARTDADGAYSLRVPRPSGGGPFLPDVHPRVVMARSPGHGVGCAPVAADGKVPPVIRLPREQILRGRFIDLQGQPVKGVRVEVLFVLAEKSKPLLGLAQPAEPSPLWWEPVVSDEQGRFRLTGIGPGHAVGVAVRDDRFRPEMLQLWKTAKQRTEEVAHALTPAQWVEGRVTYADTGKPAAGAKVSLEGTHAFADKDGRYRLNAFRDPHAGVLIARPPAGQPYLGRTAYLRPPKITVVKETLDFRLPRAVVVRGVVKEAGSGQPVPGAAVYFYPQRADNPIDTRYLAVGPVFPEASGPDGRFAIPVLPGPGHLIVKGPTPSYVPVAMGLRQLDENKPGGHRRFAHGLLRTDFKPGDEPRDLELTLRRGVAVRGTLVGPDGQAVPSAQLLTRLSTSAPMTIEEPRGVEVRGGKFDLPGCDPDRAYPVVFLAEKERWGAALRVSGKQSGKPLAVRLLPCGAARVRFLDAEGMPLEGHWAEVEMVLAPGPYRYDPRVYDGGQLAADAVNLANVHRHGYQLDKARTDAQGRITLEALVPGVTYRVIANGRVEREFTVRPGETVDLKDVKVAPE
jgi:RNA polymerase sigma factor (sigma-70 family)